MALSTGAIVGLTVGIVLALLVVLLVGFFICRMVYQHEHGRVQARRVSTDSKGNAKLRTATSASSFTSGDTDYFVNKQEFNDMLSGLEESWQQQKVSKDRRISYNMEGVEMINGAAVYSNPAFDSDRGKEFDAAVVIQSWYRGRMACRKMPKKPAEATDGEEAAGSQPAGLQLYVVKTFGLVPTGGHNKTGSDTLVKCLENMQKKTSKRREDQFVKQLRLCVTMKGLKVISSDKWVIRHSIPLKHIYSYMVAPFNDQVFGIIFRRKGITYCFAVVCKNDDASHLVKHIQDAHLASTVHQLEAARLNLQREDIRRGSVISDVSDTGEILSGLASPYLSNSNSASVLVFRNSVERQMCMPGIPQAEEARADVAAIVIQRWYRSYRTRREFRSRKRKSAHRRSQSIELLPSLHLFPVLFCAEAPVIREARTDKDTLLGTLQSMIKRRKTHDNVLFAGVSAKGLTILSSSLKRIIYKIPLRLVLTYAESPSDANTLGMLCRTKGNLKCFVVESREAQSIWKALNEAQLASTLHQLDVTRANMPEASSSRCLLESASAIVANLPADSTTSARNSLGSEALPAPLPESVTLTVTLESASGPNRDDRHVSRSQIRTMSPSSHSLSDIGSNSSMTAEAFADAAHTLLDDTLKETAQFIAAEMTRSPSKEMRKQLDEIITEDSTLRLLDEVDDPPQRKTTGAGLPTTSTPKQGPRDAGRDSEEAALPKPDNSPVEDMHSTILGLMDI